MIQNSIIKNNRITVIDALRGFALLGVILVHMQQHYSIFNFGAFEPSEPLFPILDTWVTWLTRNVLMGRFINIFAFLFGMSFFIQMDRAAKKGIDFRRRFIWRMVILFLIGIIGSAFYSGDILSFYAVFGLGLVFLYPLKNKVLIAIACLIIAGAPRWVSYSYDKITVPQETVETNVPESRPARVERSRQMPEMSRETPSIANTIKRNLTVGRQNTFRYQFNWGGRGYLTFALFILGLVVGRIRFFETVHLHPRRNWVLFIIFSTGAWLFDQVSDFIPQDGGLFIRGGTPSVMSLLRMTANDINLVFFSAAITMGFVILYHVKGIGKCLNVLTPYGRMGLTNYEIQGIIGTVLFSLWGFGSLFGRWHATELFCLGIAFYILQIIISKIWLTYFKYGPLEWLWRSATYLKWQSFRK